MGTSAIIGVEGLSGIVLYKHYDGYPDGTLPWLDKFNKEFTEKRGIDPSYKMAQLVRSSALMAQEFNLDKSTETGWGIMHSPFPNADYRYRLMDDGTVQFKGNEYNE